MDLSGSDDNFAFVMFAFVSTILAMSFLPSIFWFLWRLHSWTLIKIYFIEWWDWLTWGPKVAWHFIRHPGHLISASKVLIERRSFTKKMILPIAFRKVIRIRVILLIIFFFLLSVVLYQKLSFDPHEILGVAPGDSDAKIRKQYRRLSMQYHPDKNSSAEAKIMYTKVRRAYKMLVDPDAIDEEMANQVGVGDVHIGLPKFLMSKEYRFIVAPGLMLALFILPVALLWKILYRDEKGPLPRFLETLQWTQDQYNYFYHLMGEPLNSSDKDKPEDVIKNWHINNNDYDVGRYFTNMCNKKIDEALELIPEVVWRMRDNQQYKNFIIQYHSIQIKKQEILKSIHDDGGPPSKPQIVILQTNNKRIQQYAELLLSKQKKFRVPNNEEEMMAFAQQQQLEMQEYNQRAMKGSGRGRGRNK
eukprot:NODE_2564_length_1549_cov_50.903226_g2210_i0.p1 GENE.NODE_2564_length_1549_cov_50.903226_g2210_i0~~NODE_2564_length_1549_cov_50.903226_g2210_i0.p1  ORF type:complete len:416 (-),score=35.35 NODE_2564_length_1549_cov_50.903226_g2210_i0:244-1491(-)